ncbi:odorant receptor 13a-like [Harpegnathos saltator]|uniref:odorant receptor 13a-like n=1 Tax=Harpegnathos saltator TaxID=610380 RepID=UPI000DBEDA5D|nr:odorant receptor 13a-like [Harpegnathos saltator]
MEVTWNHYYGTVRKLSSFTGIWPFMSMRAKIFRLCFLTVTMLSLFVPQIAYQFTCKQNLQCIFESMTSYLLTSIAALKVYTFVVNIRKIREMTKHLYADWKLLESVQEYEIMKSYAENCRQFSLIYPIYCLACVCVFMSVSLIPQILDVIIPLNESRPILLPYPGYYFVDYKEYFVYIFWHSLVAFEIILAGIVAHDCMFMSYVEHICNIFAVLGYRFEYLFCNQDKIIENTKADLDSIYRKKIASFVRMQQEALKFAQVLESIFTIPFAIQLLVGTIGMSITLLQITQSSNFLKILRYALYVGGQLFHLFVLSFEGQKLMDHSYQTRDKIYSSTWYEAPMKSQKLLIMVMIRSLQPTCLSAGKVYIFSLESFSMVLQTSMSYFTVLASF